MTAVSRNFLQLIISFYKIFQPFYREFSKTKTNLQETTTCLKFE